MLLRLILLLTVVPFVELVILLQLADRFGWRATLVLILVTGVVGAWLARREGLKAVERIRTDLEHGVPPAGAVLDGFLILAAGLVLITPGILTDVAGFALLIAPVRRWVARRLGDALKSRIVVIHHGQGFSAEDPFVDVSATSRPADEAKNHAPELEQERHDV